MCRKSAHKITLILLVLSLPVSKAFAQYSKTIQSGRPGQSIGATTVGKNILQFQNGIDYNGIGISGSQYDYVTDHIIRFGILKTVELNALVDTETESFSSEDSVYKINALSKIEVGFRIHITNQKGLIPTTAFQLRFQLPHISNDYGINNPAPVMTFVATWNVYKQITLNTNLICNYNGKDANPTGKYVVNVGFPIYKKLSGFIESYGELTDANFENRYDGGFAYLLTDNIQLDLSAGYGNNEFEDYFLSGGISWRLNFRNSTP